MENLQSNLENIFSSYKLSTFLYQAAFIHSWNLKEKKEKIYKWCEKFFGNSRFNEFESFWNFGLSHNKIFKFPLFWVYIYSAKKIFFHPKLLNLSFPQV